MECVPEYVVGASCRQGWGINGFFGVGFEGLELVAWSVCWGRYGRVGGSERAVARAGVGP
jgi:hypothetical protein